MSPVTGILNSVTSSNPYAVARVPPGVPTAHNLLKALSSVQYGKGSRVVLSHYADPTSHRYWGAPDLP